MTFLSLVGFMALFLLGLWTALAGIFGAIAHQGLSGTPAPWPVWACIVVGVLLLVLAVFKSPFTVSVGVV